ncbi:MAG: response regulator [Betaproteobacteria bacterium]|nr:response regulator [Betaproteobacteria bacterium]
MESSLKKIMLVEDDPDIQLITRLSLEVGGGYEVRVCGSGAQAVQCARAYAPDLILLDVMMPGMDGIATMDALRELPGIAAIPVVFFTANAQRQVQQDLLLRGALGVIVKPIEPQALVEQIRMLWQRSASPASP